MTTAHNLSDGYPIGSVARLTGVPVETLRTWERRYGVPSPMREQGGRRLFSGDEVERLRRIAELTKRGERVRDLASLDDAALGARLTALQGGPEPVPTVFRVAVLNGDAGDALAGLTPSGLTRIEVVASAPSVATLPAGIGPVDVIVLHAHNPAADIVAELDLARGRAGTDSAVVVASFLSRRVRRALSARRVRVVDTPRLSELRRIIEDTALVARLAAGSQTPVLSAAPRFDRDALVRLSNVQSELACECTNHLAALVMRMQAFELYSRQCEVEGGPDAELHRALAEGTAGARATMEALLTRLAVHDGLIGP